MARLQPNCSEIIFYLEDMDSTEALRLLEKAMEGQPVLDTSHLPWGESEEIRGRSWRVYENENIRDILRARVEPGCEVELTTLEVLDRLAGRRKTKNKLTKAEQKINAFSADFQLDDDTLEYNQHCQYQGFATIAKFSELSGLQPKPFDGGSLSDYIEWKKKNGIPLTEYEAGYGE